MTEDKVLLKIIRKGNGIIFDCILDNPYESMELIKAIDVLRDDLLERLERDVNERLRNEGNIERPQMIEVVESLKRLVNKLKSCDKGEREQILKDINGILNGR